MAAVVGNKPFRINDWRVEPSLNRLSRADEVVKIDPQNMKVLELLASRPGEVISQSEIEETAWAGVIVTSNSVYQSIAQLRRALSDDKSNPRYIETIARKGYRLVGRVSEVTFPAAAREDDSLGNPIDEISEPRLDARVVERAAALQRIGLAVLTCLLATAVGMQLYGPTDSLHWTAMEATRVLRTNSPAWETKSDGQKAERFSGLGRSAAAQGRPQQAITYYEHALDLQRKVTGNHDPFIAEILSELAYLHSWNDDHTVAETNAREALHLLEQSNSQHNPRLILIHDTLGNVLLNAGRFAEAEGHINRAIELARLVYGEEDIKTANARYSLAILRIHQGQAVEAEALLDHVLRIYISKDGEDEPTTAYTRAVLAIALFQQNRYEEGAAATHKAIESLRRTARPNHPYFGTAQQVLGDCLAALGQYDKAEHALRASIEVWRANDAKPWRVARAASSLGEALVGQGRVAEAEEHLSYASQILEKNMSATQHLAMALHEKRVRRFRVAQHLGTVKARVDAQLPEDP